MSKHICGACALTSVPSRHTAHRCAFEASVFSPENWCCELLEALRALAEDDLNRPDGVAYTDHGQKFVSYAIDQVLLDDEPLGLTLWMSWYKDRGRIEALWLLDEHNAPRRPSEREIVAVLQAYGRTPVASTKN